MRISRLIGSINWKYALGEFLLIVVGILVALAANSWYANRSLRSDEIDYLQRIRASLEIDLENVSRNQLAYESAVSRLEALKFHLEARRPYSEELDASFAELQFFYGGRLRTSIYESLRARGLDLISSDELQFALIELYEEHNAALDRQNGYVRENSFSQLQPYVRQHFSVDIGKATPYDYDALLDDRYYLNLVGSTVMARESFTLPAYRDAVDAINHVIALIDEELQAF